MELINKRVTDNGTKVFTYINTAITDYPEEIQKQRTIAIDMGIVDSQESYFIGYKDVGLVKSIIDGRSEGYDGTELANEILLSGNHREYLAEWFKGRGSHRSHFSNILLMTERVAPQVAELTGYELERQGKAWELRKEK